MVERRLNIWDGPISQPGRVIPSDIEALIKALVKECVDARMKKFICFLTAQEYAELENKSEYTIYVIE